MRRKLNSLINLIAKETKTDKSVVYHFILADLEKLHEEKIEIHKVKFQTLETELKELKSYEIETKNKIDSISKENEKLKIELVLKNENIESQNKVLSENKTELKRVTERLHEIKREKEITEEDLKKKKYELIMNRHTKEKQTPRYKYQTWFLTICTILAIIFALILIKNYM